VLPLPANIGKYELQEFLGGGMSHVYRAQDTLLGRQVAVKILTPQGVQDPEAKARFLQEARVASNINHQNIISVYDFGDEGGKPFMVMEFLVGESLRDAMKNHRTGDLNRKLSYALQIGRALEHIHSKKIIHRDIKPENIHIDGSGKVKLMDFGIAKAENVSLTRAGFTLGTPYYMAPEQVMGQQITAQVDVYAFGVLLYEMILGTKPISGDTVEKIFSAILYEPLNLEPLRLANVPEPVYNLVAACTAKNAAERPQGFGVVCAELERILQNPSASGRSQILRPPAVQRPVPAGGSSADEMPGWVRSLPPFLQSQGALIAVVGLGVMLVMLAIAMIAMQFIK
jgi:serine/threonine-protein kinase